MPCMFCVDGPNLRVTNNKTISYTLSQELATDPYHEPVNSVHVLTPSF